MTALAPDAVPRLPRPAEYPLFRGRLGRLVFRPWYDRMALHAVVRWYLPLSRAWAAALNNAGGVAPLLDALGRDGGSAWDLRWAARLLETLGPRRAAFEAAGAAWEAALFAAQSPGDATLVARERARQDAAQRVMAARAAALPLHLRRPLPPVRFDIAPPDTVAERHGARLADPRAAFPAPEPSELARSHAVPGAYGGESWLRYRAPVLGDTAWARVTAPAGVADPPTLVFLHGVAVEAEFWRDIADGLSGLAGRGVRVVRPEGPWHGRRRLAGFYGGEPVMARGPLGMIELFEAWVAEAAVLIAWARRTSRGPVALAGVSLGALTSQLVLAAARHWPAEMTPDAALLAATSGSLLEVAEHGSLARGIGLWPRMRERGWSEAEMTRWLPLLEPQGAPGIAPARIVMLLGERDDLTPYTGGRALARRWAVPEPNLVVRRRGHFSVWLALGGDPAPIERLLALLGRT